MKPRRLEIAAFGPYAESETIDFAKLDGRPLVLIHGPTGGGKTSILDAICFALFGDTSGGDRSGQQMRCELAAEDRLTEVTYDFTFQGREYRVRRSPTQERPKKRGEGTTTHSHTASAWERTDDEGDGRLVRSGASDVSAWVAELFGFTAEQFRQVVVLPQGQFRRLLLADSTAKEAILESLFSVVLYKKVMDGLDRRAGTLRKAYEEATAKARGLLEHVEVEDEAGLVVRIEGQRQQLTALQEREAVARATRDAARKALESGRADHEALKAHRDAVAALGKLEERKAEVDGLRARLRDARRAEPLVERAGALDRRRDELGKREHHTAACAKRVERAVSRVESATAALRAEEARKPELEDVGNELARLQGMDERVRRLVEAQAELVEARKALAGAEERAGKAAARAADAEGRWEKAEAAARSASEEAAKAPALQLELERLAAAAERVGKAAEARKKWEGARDEAERLQARAKQLRSAADDKRAIHEALELRWRHGQAAVLASSLAEGEPCPVCGATEHPAPAERGDDAPTDALLESAAAASREAEREAAKAASGAAAATATATQLQTSHEEEVAALGEVEVEVDGLEDRLAAVRTRAAAAERAGQSQEAAVGRAEAAKRALEEARTAAEQAAKARDEAERRVDSAQTTVRERGETVPEALREEGALAATRRRLEARRKQLVDALETARAAVGSAQEEQAAARAALDEAKKAEATTRDVLAEEQAELEERRGRAGLGQDEDWAAARKDVAAIESLDRQVRAYDESLASVRGRVETTGAKAEGVEAPDLEALVTAEAETAGAYEALVKERGAAEEAVSESVRLLEQYRAILGESADLDRQYRVVGTLADVARGRGGNKRNLSFPRFVLAVLLDEVLLQASARLLKLTRGRYRLVRSDTVVHKGRQSGLDLEVVDAYSGTRRRVETLSGGESFLAALALSLGLTDVVQGASGGVQLDTLFIDEGFGTLDPESLDRALEVLVGMNATGRLVGIISHVGELKGRIDTRLEVLPTDRGSTTRLTVG